MVWNGTECNGMQWDGAVWGGVKWRGMEWNGIECNGMGWGGVEWNGMEWGGRELLPGRLQTREATKKVIIPCILDLLSAWILLSCK